MKATCRVCGTKISSTDEEALIKKIQEHALRHRFFFLAVLQKEKINRFFSVLTFDGLEDIKQKLFQTADEKENFQ